MAKGVVRYRTSTGGLVQFSPGGDDGIELSHYFCDACGEQEDGLFLRPAHAQAHADRCRALPD